MVEGKIAFVAFLAVIGSTIIGGVHSSLPVPETCENTTDKGGVEWLRVDYCAEGEDFCERTSGVVVDYIVLFTPKVSTIGFSVTAVARLNKTDAPTPVSYSYRDVQLEGDVPVGVRQSLVLPATGNGENVTEMFVQWIIESEDKGVELCREYVFHVTDRNASITLPGNSTGDNCTTTGIPCNFPNSVCNGALVCECGASALENGGQCIIKPWSWCNANGDCGANGECVSQANGVKTCVCKDGAFEMLGRCEANTGAVEGADCLKSRYPCGIDRLVCGEDLKCACDAASAWDGKVCRRRIGFPCTADSQCVENAACTSTDDGSVCNCNLGYAPRLGQCELLNEGGAVGETCLEPNYPCNFTDSICAFVSATAPVHTCVCDTGFIYQDACKRKVGMECLGDGQCVSGAGCVFKNNLTSSCECRSGTVVMEDGTCFAPQGDKVGEFCNVGDAPCAFPFSVCSAEGKRCGCAAEAVDQSGMCKIPYGSACGSSSDCVAFATCENGVCACEGGVEELEDGKCAGCGIALYAPLLALAVFVSLFN